MDSTLNGPPYPPQTWQLGGREKISVDVPVSAVFLFLFIIGAVLHMSILIHNKKNDHNFLISGPLFGFCMARIVALILRIASTCLPQNIRLAIAGNVFVNAGVVIIFIVNLIFVQRIIRAAHPRVGWHDTSRWIFLVLNGLVVVTIIMIIVVIVQSVYTLNANTHRIDRDIQLSGITFFAVISFLPIPMTLMAILVPRVGTDKFGTGRWRTKIRILLVSALLVSFGAIYRAATIWQTPVPFSKPMPWYFHKAAFYICYFAVEITVVLMYAAFRVDKRFYIRDHAKGPGSYTVEKIRPTSTPVSPEPSTAALEYGEPKPPRPESSEV